MTDGPNSGAGKTTGPGEKPSYSDGFSPGPVVFTAPLFDPSFTSRLPHIAVAWNIVTEINSVTTNAERYKSAEMATDCTVAAVTLLTVSGDDMQSEEVAASAMSSEVIQRHTRLAAVYVASRR